MSSFMVFLIGFCIGGVVGCDSPKTNTNTPPALPKIVRKYREAKEVNNDK